MHKEIIINSTPNEARVALLEDHEVVEFMMERADNKRAVGNVYKGVVTAVRPGLQAAFVDIGMEKGGFLHVSDLVHDDPGDVDEGGRGRGRGRGRRREGLRPIETMLKEGDEILVQVTKEVIGTKGPRLTADISLPGRFMVLMPKGDHVGVSRKIEDRKERGRLKGILSDLKPDDEAGAFIIRTAAIGQDAKMIERDMQYLRDLWKAMNQKAHSVQAPAVVHEDVGLIVSLIRDIFKNDVDSVVVDNKDDHTQLMQYVKTFSPDLRDRITLYNGEMPIFDKYGIEAELKKSLDKKVWMKRGGFLVIEQTEALVAIDVNTGRFIGKKNQAETIFKTNMLAAKEIARQLRLRDVGGIIVLDFIDMENEEDKRRVLAELRTHLKRDRSRTKTFAVSDLGLIEMSRQRVQESLKDRLSDNCPYCNGSGQVLSVDTLSNKVERLLAKLSATRNEKAVQVRANPTLALQLMTERANTFQQIERSTGMQIDVVDDARLHREEFQIVSLSRRKDLVAEIEKSDDGHRGGGEDRRSRGDSERRSRGGRDRDDRGQQDDADANDGRRRRRRRDESRDEAPAERRGRSRRGRDEREASTESRDDRPQRDESGESGREDRPRRRRRGERRDDDSRSRESRPADEPREEVAKTEQHQGHPAEEGGEDRPRRRRRRGRRGGRGRRRGRADENADTANEANAETQSDERPESRSAEAPRDAVETKPEAPRPRGGGEREPAHDERPRSAAAKTETAAPDEAPRDASSAVDDDGGTDRRPERRRRRRRRSASSERPAASEDTSTTAEPPRDEPRAATPAVGESAEDRERPVTEETADEDTRGAVGTEDTNEDDSDDRPRRRRRRGGRGRRAPEHESSSSEDSEPVDAETPPEPASQPKAAPEPSAREAAPRPGNGTGGPIDSRDSYVGPVPEGSTDGTEAQAPELENPPIQPGLVESSEPASATEAEEEDENEARVRRRRRRKRTRQTGTPTRLIGTGRQKDDAD